MRTLTFRQPWASLILDGKKLVEVRVWDAKQVGPVIVHAGKKIDVTDANRLQVDKLDTGCFLGIVEIVDVFLYDEQKWRDDYPRHLTSGELGENKLFGWVLANPRWFLNKIPGNGRLGFFNAPPEVEREAARL